MNNKFYLKYENLYLDFYLYIIDKGVFVIF